MLLLRARILCVAVGMMGLDVDSADFGMVVRIVLIAFVWADRLKEGSRRPMCCGRPAPAAVLARDVKADDESLSGVECRCLRASIAMPPPPP